MAATEPLKLTITIAPPHVEAVVQALCEHIGKATPEEINAGNAHAALAQAVRNITRQQTQLRAQRSADEVMANYVDPDLS